MYLIGFGKSKSLCGNAAMMSCSYKSQRKIRETAQSFAKLYKHDEVYGLRDYSQRVCEMGREEYIAHVRKNGVRYV